MRIKLTFKLETYSSQIDQAMLKLTPISISLRQLKNSLASINRLPPEILALIPTFRESEKDLISATAVCKYWRRTLISAPILWNNIVCSEQASRDAVGRLVRMYFERSGSVPVNVQMHARASRLLSPYTGRISQLTIFLENRSDLDEIAEHLSKSAPLIETVAIRVSHWHERGLVLPPGFFEAFLSSARTLTLRGAILSPGPCRLSKLTRFTLKMCLANVTSTILLDTLDQMPLLQLFDAHLKCANEQDPVPGDRVVTLPHLEVLTVTIYGNWSVPVASPILPALRLPRARRVVLVSTGAFDAPLTPILPLSFKERLPSLSVLPKASVTLDKDFNIIKFFGSAESELKVCTRPIVPYSFDKFTFGGIPFDNVRKICVSFRSLSVDTVFFINLLRSMRGLEYLKVFKNAVGPVASWIGEDEQNGICPALATLIIVDDKAKECVEVLKQVRERAGVPIANVEIRYD